MLKKFPSWTTEEEVDEWLKNADLSEYDLSDAKLVTFELAPNSAAIGLRLPAELLSAIEARSAETRIPVQQLIRTAIEDFLRRGAPKRPRKARASGKSAGAGAA